MYRARVAGRDKQYHAGSTRGIYVAPLDIGAAQPTLQSARVSGEWHSHDPARHGGVIVGARHAGAKWRGNEVSIMARRRLNRIVAYSAMAGRR